MLICFLEIQEDLAILEERQLLVIDIQSSPTNAQEK